MTTWVLLRGLAREARHWGNFPARLRSQLPPGERVLLLDLPGNGSEWRQRSPSDIDGMVAAVRAQARTRARGEPLLLVALSLGGMVALRWAAQAPQELAGLVLINSSGAGLSALHERLQPRSYLRLLHCLLPGLSIARRERGIYLLTSNLPEDRGVLEQWVLHARTQPVTRANFARQLWAAARFRADSAPAVPMLLLASEADRLVSPACSRQLAAAWRVPLRTHPWAGHDLPLDDPAWVVQKIIAWRG